MYRFLSGEVVHLASCHVIPAPTGAEYTPLAPCEEIDHPMHLCATDGRIRGILELLPEHHWELMAELFLVRFDEVFFLFRQPKYAASKDPWAVSTERKFRLVN